MRTAQENTSQENTSQNFQMYKLRIQTPCDDNDDAIFESIWFSSVEKRIQSAIAAAVAYQYTVKITLTYGDTVRVYQFDTYLK